MKKIQRRLAAIMFTDMVGYSALMQKDEQLAGSLRDRHRDAFVRNTNASGGEILQYYGDGTLSIYPSALAAVECAIRIQQELQQKPTVPLRIGIHTGDISYGDEDVFGDGVNIASRIEKLCTPGGVFISGKVYDDIKNSNDIKARLLGPFKLKNITKEIEIYAITNEGIIAPPPGEFHRISPFGRRPETFAPSRPVVPPATPPVAVAGRKRKGLAGVLAFFFGVFGTHRFYLGQRRLGMLYLGLFMTGMFIIKSWSFLIPLIGMVSFIDAIILWAMPKRDFDRRYNSVAVEAAPVTETYQYERPKRKIRREAPPKKQKTAAEKQFEKYWKKALDEYQEYDYGETITALQKAIEIKPNDPEVHFLLACCYSINEDVSNALEYLDLAVANGLKDLDRIQNHNDLAYLRMQPQYEAFVKNGYRFNKPISVPTEDLLQLKDINSPDLLEQLQKLQALREDGQLTDKEYELLKRRLGR